MSKNDRNQDVEAEISKKAVEQEKNWTAITLEEAKKLLAERHEVVFPANDPLMMQVTMMQVFLENQEKLMDVMRGRYAEQAEATIKLALDLVQEFADNLPAVNQANQAIQQEPAPQQDDASSLPPFVYFLMFLVVVLMLLLVGVMKGIF